MPQDVNRCVIDAINMYVGGPLYDTYEKFYEYYSYVKKMKKRQAPEDVAMNGVGIVNLHNLIVSRAKNQVYYPSNVAMISYREIQEALKYAKNPGDDLFFYCPKRCLI